MRRNNGWAGLLALVLLISLTGCASRSHQDGASLWYTANLEEWDNATTALALTGISFLMVVIISEHLSHLR